MLYKQIASAEIELGLQVPFSVMITVSLTLYLHALCRLACLEAESMVYQVDLLMPTVPVLGGWTLIGYS